MAASRRCAIGGVGLLAGLLLGGAGPALAGAEPEPVALREQARIGTATRVVIEMKADGQSRPALPTGPAGPEGGGREAKALAFRVETRFAFDERVAQVDARQAAQRAARLVTQAAAAINGEVRPTASALRPEVALLVAELREGRPMTYSAGGPLTRAELELVEGPGDPLALPALLPEKPVAVGDRWTVGDPAARSVSSYEALAANALEAELEAIDAGSARIALRGEIRGAVLGGEGTMACTGWFTFDRKAGRIDRLNLTRTESRRAGPVETGLSVKSTLTLERREVAPPAALGDDVLAKLPAGPRPDLERLLYVAPDGKYRLVHDRDWHLFADNTRQTVLKRLDHGEPVAQCNLVAGPNAGKGRHQDLEQFRDDIRRALGRRFGRVLEAGEVEGPPEGGFRYRVAVQGQEGGVGVLWYYYLVAGPEGDQLLVAFTLGAAQAKQFADQDLRLIGALEWTGPAGDANHPAEPGAKPAP